METDIFMVDLFEIITFYGIKDIVIIECNVSSWLCQTAMSACAE